MEKEFIPYEQALALKELGFDEPCIKYYWTDGMFTKTYESPFNHNKRDNLISAPLYQQAFRWFREKHNIDSYHIEPTNNMFSNFYGVLGLRTATFNGGFKTYEEAELACLKKLIEIVKQK
jgi:hypothetical protein